LGAKMKADYKARRAAKHAAQKEALRNDHKVPKMACTAQTKEEKIDDVGCEFCADPPTRMFKAPKEPIIITYQGRNFKAIKPYWLACSFCATCIETNHLDELQQHSTEAIKAMAAYLNLPEFAGRQQELKQDILKMSFKCLGLETIRKALELPSKPIDKAMVAAGNRATTAALDALKDATGSTEHAAAMFESSESTEPN
jgi:hypothetical protein